MVNTIPVLKKKFSSMFDPRLRYMQEIIIRKIYCSPIFAYLLSTIFITKVILLISILVTGVLLYNILYIQSIGSGIGNYSEYSQTLFNLSLISLKDINLKSSSFFY